MKKIMTVADAAQELDALEKRVAARPNDYAPVADFIEKCMAELRVFIAVELKVEEMEEEGIFSLPGCRL